MICFTYPGQGSQEAKMGLDWVDHPSWELVAEASQVAGRDITHLLLHADDDELRQTRNSQLATFMVSMIALDAVARVGIETTCHAGHSLGEYSALVAAGVIDFADGVRLVTERGEAMQVAAEEQDGTMAAIVGLDDNLVEQACTQAAGEVWVANYNAPGQVVIAGSPAMVGTASTIAKDLGAKRVIPLPVGGAFHTPYMASARERLQKVIGQTEFRAPDHPVYANVDASAHTNYENWADLLSMQLTSPVRWRQSLHNMCDAGCTTFVELGPGAVLTGTVKRTAKGAKPLKVNSPADIDAVLEALASPTVVAAGPLEGEALFATERLVVSPAAGIFQPTTEPLTGAAVSAGHLLGQVGASEVRTPWNGIVMGFLAVEGERVAASQPIAWLRTH
ncbi:MAG: ACP S-malonyltransferase [Acidimicrobiia bacterium]|nr:ACP S-malonyltransferase [Acidimicrobiia bacterium]MYC57204.1 ACP S-malonyltransferase [Acidimicrobiia bacterium]MYG93869.1 ACP S-malonyltransferase [Acidimicrobiia bacterium]MYI29872.1 ACP S-malonyltransferase [Acidimicrobiia bacterium]